MVHIHGRAPDGGPTWSVETYAEIKREVQARSPIIVNFSTGGFNMGAAGEAEKSERLSYVRKTRPEIAALNMGSMNYAKYPGSGRHSSSTWSSPTRSETSCRRRRR